MIKERIINWFQKLGIKIEINPALTIAGLFTISLGKIVVDPNNWGKSEEEKIADLLQKTVKISLEEYRELLKEEVKDKTEKETETIVKNIIESYKEKFEEIAQLIKENPTLTLEEFKERTEIQNLLKYKFVGAIL